ncbi:MAG TPA: glycosyltransferase family 9 protein [Bacteroidia bacterium]|nr:glycosyltransferase family 9 protein [Bacteroidia bacterium]
MLNKLLVIQTAFPGDVILATALLESLHHSHPECKIDVIIRNGNETLFNQHPFINSIIVWDKSKNKLPNLFKLIFKVRDRKYDLVINLQRFASSGLLTTFSGAKESRGFDKNPFSGFFSKKYKHTIGDGRHETERNHDLIRDLCGEQVHKPKLYPQIKDFEKVQELKKGPYICIAPGSVWFTKKFPEKKWIEFIKTYSLKNNLDKVYLIGSATEHDLCERIKAGCASPMIDNLAGKLSLLQSAALIKDAKMNYVNDSAPMHLASAMNGKTTAVFCSTVPTFGFGPLSEIAKIVETTEDLACRPCGIHGYNYCPLGHFNCAETIDVKQLISENG